MSDNPGRVDIHYVLDKLYYSHDNPRDKGTGFERFIKSFLVTEPLYAGRFEQVWMWSDWPERGSRPDHGIDLVARERDTGDLVAVQCKFFDPSAALPKGEIDSFLAESGKHPFRSRLLVTTAGRLNSAAEAAIEDQQIPVNVIGLEDLVGSTLDWAQFDPTTREVLTTLGRKHLRTHQRTAIDAALAGFTEHDRGQLIMACCTGKTFTSLRLAEEVVPPGGRVLFLVPSIALLNQSLKEWSAEATDPLRTFAACSDTKVGKGKHVEWRRKQGKPARSGPKPAREPDRTHYPCPACGDVGALFYDYWDHSADELGEFDARGIAPISRFECWHCGLELSIGDWLARKLEIKDTTYFSSDPNGLFPIEGVGPDFAVVGAPVRG